MSAWRKKHFPYAAKLFLPVLFLLVFVAAALAVIGLRGGGDTPVDSLNTESGMLVENSSEGVAGASTISPEATPTPDAGLSEDSYATTTDTDGGLQYECCGPFEPVVTVLPFPHLPPGYIDPDDDGFLPGSPLSINGYYTISGRVTDPWGRGIFGVSVNATPFSSQNIWPLPNPFSTDANGFYSVEFGPTWPPDIMAQSTFLIHFAGHPSGNYGWVDEWYNNTRDVNLATPVPLGSQGVDAVLMPTGIIHGRITNFSDGCWADPMVSCAEVFAYQADNPVVAGSTRTGQLHDGFILGFIGNAFSFDSLPAGDYKLLAQPRSMIFDGSSIARTTTYEKTWYGPGNSWDTATVISVTPGSMSDVSIKLETSNYPTLADSPAGVPDNDSAATDGGSSGGAVAAAVETITPAAPATSNADSTTSGSSGSTTSNADSTATGASAPAAS